MVPLRPWLAVRVRRRSPCAPATLTAGPPLGSRHVQLDRRRQETRHAVHVSSAGAWISSPSFEELHDEPGLISKLREDMRTHARRAMSTRATHGEISQARYSPIQKFK